MFFNRKEKERQENERLEQERKAKVFQHCSKEIARYTQLLCESITSVYEKANITNLPNEIAQGIYIQPLYAFYKVLLTQNGVPTPEQKVIVGLFFSSLKRVNFSEQDFWTAAKTQNPARQYMEELVGVSDDHLGAFWILYLQAVSDTKSNQQLNDMVQHFTSIITCFALVGNPNSEVALPLCQGYANALQKQIQALSGR